MKQKTKTLLLALLLAMLPIMAHSQVVVGSGEEYDFDYLTPKTYEIGGISFVGAENFDTRVVQLVAGLQVGDKVKIPGDKISGAIENLWKQGMFDDVQIRVSRIQGNIAFLTIVLHERPRMLKFAFKGVKKGEDKKLREEIQIKSGDVVTENMLRTSSNKIKSYFIGKGFTRVEVTPTTESDTSGRLIVTFNVNRGKKVKIDSLIFVGNQEISTSTLKGKMQKTRDVHFRKSLRFWKKVFWKKSIYMENDFREDLDNIIAYYNEQGYRDARIVMDTVWETPQSELKNKDQDRLKIKVVLHEGKKFYFRNITFSGNTVYSDDVLRRSLRISKGDPYNKKVLEENLSYNPSGTDLTSLYMDNGYLFFRATPVEVAVENDSIDIEVRIVEDKQARIRNVSIEGNTITNDKVIMRELHTRPGDLFSREAMMRSYRELLTLKFFEEQSVRPEPRPDPKNGTVDIVYHVKEGSTSQLNLQGGYGSGMFIFQVGIQLNTDSESSQVLQISEFDVYARTQYMVEVPVAGNYDLRLRVSSRAFLQSPEIRVYCDGEQVADQVLPVTGMTDSQDVWKTQLISSIALPAGKHRIELRSARSTTCKVNWLRLDMAGDVNGDLSADIADVNAVINVMLGNQPMTDMADQNGSGTVDISDVNRIINLMLGK